MLFNGLNQVSEHRQVGFHLREEIRRGLQRCVEHMRDALDLAQPGFDLRSVQEIDRDAFPLGRLTTRLGALRAQIRSGLGFGYVKGLPVARYDRETLIRIYWGLCRHIGDPVTQNRNGHLVGHVIDIGDSVADANKRITQTNAELCFHTDSCDVVALLCINRAESGGESMIVSGVSVASAR